MDTYYGDVWAAGEGLTAEQAEKIILDAFEAAGWQASTSLSKSITVEMP